MYCRIHILNPFFYRNFRHIQAYSRPIKIYSAMLWHIYTPALLLHIQNPTIFTILAYLKPYIQNSRHILVYSKRCVTLAYWELCHIQNFAITRILAYLGPEIIQNPVHIANFRYIQAYSIIIVITTLTFFFLTLILHTFHRNLKRHMFFDYNYNDINFNARLSLLKYAIFQNGLLRE